VVAAIERGVRDRFGTPRAGELWIGDDAAVVQAPPGALVLAADAALAGVHADLSLVSLGDLGWKAMAAAISDIGAMGARPLHALVTIGVPGGVDVAEIVSGVLDAGREWGCTVVGGDLTRADQALVSVAVTGALDEPDGAPVTRAGAVAGDAVLVTGPLGASAAGLRLLQAGAGGRPEEALPQGPEGVAGNLLAAHRRPRARVAEGRAARLGGASAMIDVSDGLSIDLERLAVASGVGIALVGVPVAPGATEEEALGGGEDFELVIATRDPDRLLGQFARAGLRPPLPIGTCTADPSVRTLRGRPLPLTGWQHELG
jgi:thiamine-monophosphate kinase